MTNSNSLESPLNLFHPVKDLPYITPEIPGIGGVIKLRPSDFVVEEIPLIEPVGDGPHIYVTLEREGINTRYLKDQLQKIFELKENDTGYAGLKDRNARSTQCFSLYLPDRKLDEVSGRITSLLDGVKIISMNRSNRRLAVGQLKGNRFTILIRPGDPAHTESKSSEEIDAWKNNSLRVCSSILSQIERQGLPNFYGAQRFGNNGENCIKGRALLLQKKRNHGFLRELYLSAYQSLLFNHWLSIRMREYGLNRLLTGDVARRRERGALFLVRENEVGDEELIYTGPIFGRHMRSPEGVPLQIEEELLSIHNMRHAHFQRAHLPGSRRDASVKPEDVQIRSHTDGVQLSFFLPAGSYATTLLREVMKDDPEKVITDDE